VNLGENDPTYRARQRGCTCDWIRGFGVGEVQEEWVEKILNRDPLCLVQHEE
jgi:hypothetical protein